MDNGGAGSFWENFGILIPVIIIMLFSIFFKRRRGGKTHLEMVASLLSEINHNLEITDTFSSNWQIKKKLKTDNWNRNKDKIDFLDQELQNNLSNAFSLAEDFNQRIADAKRYKSTSYLAGIQADRLIEPFAKSKDRLDEWLQANYQAELSQRGRGLFG